MTRHRPLMNLNKSVVVIAAPHAATAAFERRKSNDAVEPTVFRIFRYFIILYYKKQAYIPSDGADAAKKHNPISFMS